MDYFHKPVLLEEVIEYLNTQPNQNFIDATIGGGGHAKAILKKTSPKGHLLGLDRDPKAIKAAKKNLSEFSDRVLLVLDSYKNLPHRTSTSLVESQAGKNKKIYEQKFNLHFSGLLLDLGISSAQVAPEDDRGFSFQTDKKLDMRFGPDGDLTAAEILNTWPKEKLIKIFKEYGQEPRARVIAGEIILFRARKPIELTSDLVNIVNQVFRGQLDRHKGRRMIHPATKVFQALRIAVNNELENLKESLPNLLASIESGGRLVVISYHSLEDKIVKEFFKYQAKDCHCPKEFPICKCNHKKSIKILTKKPIVPTDKEVEANPRSRSAKMRVAEKI